MQTTEIHLDKNLVDKAVAYAAQKGENLTSLIESYLSRLVQQENASEETVPDIVLSLLGAGDAVAEDDLNGRQAYHNYLEEKYR